MKLKNKAKIKATLLSAAAVATSFLIGMAACTTKPSGDDDDGKTTTKQDVQIIKNGNFEFYDDKDGVYAISNPDNWTAGSSGSTSSAKAGIINTAKANWDYITDESFPAKLDENNDLTSSDKNYVDYNGLTTSDLPFKNTHDAILEDATEEQKAYIDNPFTHAYSYDEDGKILDAEGNEVQTYEDEDGKVYLDEELTQELETSILMLHNYRPSYYKGTETYYSANTTLTLEARTAAKISVWVKTAELYFDGATNTRTEVENEHGAYIKVGTSVGGNALDNFCIRNINTEILNPDGENNGWVQYTVYVQASSFASTTLNVTLGLGQNEIYTVEGYAFFDDVEVTTYESAAQMIEEAEEQLGDGEFGEVTKNTTANLLSPDSESEFRVDKESVQTNDKTDGSLVEWKDDHNFGDYHFYIDLTSSNSDDSPIEFVKGSAYNISAGLTVEQTTTGKYVSSQDDVSDKLYKVNALSNGAAGAYLPSSTFKSISTSEDFIGAFNVTNDENWTFNAKGADYKYNKVLTSALKSAAALPGANGSAEALVMLSAKGAAYAAELTQDTFTLNAGEYALITFWLKTSDMKGKTAATVTVKETGTADADENTANFTLDTTTLGGVTINDTEDFYNGWAECFIRVENKSKEDAKSFKLCFNFGNTTIQSTTETNYGSGWIAVANASFMKLEEDVFNFTSGLSNIASLTLSDTENKTSNAFDTEQGDKNVIKNDLATPSNYAGVNGAGAWVVNDYDATIDSEYHAKNRNDYAGILNKENMATYKKNAEAQTGCEWYSLITAMTNLQDADPDTVWDTIFGKLSVQPLLIVNAMREYVVEETAQSKIYNYGYIGKDSSVSAKSYTAVSVRVKVSAGAVANVYLVDTDLASKQVLSFSLPKYTFWYDDNGNILKGEPKENASVEEIRDNIAYTLRSDGLYENGDGKLYANLYNYSKTFKDLDFEHETFYDENGVIVAYENLVEGKAYYANAQKTAYAPHYIIANGTKVYKYNQGLGDDATYYYMVDYEPDTSKVVHALDISMVDIRYDNSEKTEYAYQFTIDATTSEGAAKYADKWITVTFYLHAGSKAKSYKLEIWSGYRDEQSTEGVTENSYVIFDYNTESLSETSYNDLVDEYTNAIIDEYKKIITDEQDELSNNISYYEKQLTEAQIKEVRSKAFNYVAEYYTYTLYDSDLYVPFNADTAADDETGYAYNYSDHEESLAYLRVEDVEIGDEYLMSAFVDYSMFDNDISLGKSAPVDDSPTTTPSTSNSDNMNLGLLLASILLLAAIVLALLAILIKELVKRFRRNSKSSGKNTYNFNKNKRYVRKYVKANGEVTGVEEGDMDASLLTDEQPDEVVEETPVEETPAEEAPVEEPPAETPAEEAPVEEAPAETPADGEGADGENKE